MVEFEHLSDKAKQDLMLVERAKQGNQAAFASLMDRYRESIYFMMLKMVKNSDDAEDLTIEAFGKAFNRIDQYSPSFAFSTWLFKIASNNGIDFILAAGGGSVVDCAKSIALGVNYDGDVWDIYLRKGDSSSSLPLGVIITFLEHPYFFFFFYHI